MTVEIEVKGKRIPFRLDPPHWRWHSLVELEEGDFPLIVHFEGKRYALYSDGTFAEEE